MNKILILLGLKPFQFEYWPVLLKTPYIANMGSFFLF